MSTRAEEGALSLFCFSSPEAPLSNDATLALSSSSFSLFPKTVKKL